MGRIAGEGVDCHKAECRVHTASSRILVIRRIIARVVGQAYPFVDVKIYLGSEIVLVQLVRISSEHTFLIVVTS